MAKAHDLIVLADAAQSFGASLNGKKVGTLASYTATSFYPSKPLGGYGDGGAIFTDDDAKAKLLRLAPLPRQGAGPGGKRICRAEQPARYHPGGDPAREAPPVSERDRGAAECGRPLRRRLSATIVQVPTLIAGAASVWAQYTILVERRDEFAKACREAGLPTAIHYLSPIHALPSYRDFPRAPGLRHTDQLARRVISLPMHGYLAPETQDRIVGTVQAVVRSLKAGVAAE